MDDAGQVDCVHPPGEEAQEPTPRAELLMLEFGLPAERAAEPWAVDVQEALYGARQQIGELKGQVAHANRSAGKLLEAYQQQQRAVGQERDLMRCCLGEFAFDRFQIARQNSSLRAEVEARKA